MDDFFNIFETEKLDALIVKKKNNNIFIIFIGWLTQKKY